ncbi:MAG: hypothetical protein GF346_10680, partial [Candidatus Eisenbacteria bacterium]|nr:hypothetical protein [Candidatus Latescibacterota bacterium]MBD3302902.1 hypothetical protein [Candidatus Eisenbacteria bacterium]
VRDLLVSASLRPLILGIAITLTFPLFSAWRWRAIMDGLGQPLTLGEAFTFIMACWPLTTFTPSKGGDLARAWFLRGRSPVSLVLGSVLAERLIDVLVLLGFCLAGSLWFGWDLLAGASGGLLAAGLAGTAILLAVRLPIPEKFRPKVERLLLALRVILARPGLLAFVLVVTIANWMASVVQTWLFYRALGAAAPFGSVLAALPAAIFVGLIPVTLMGMGTRDAALIRLLAPVAPAPVSLGAGLLYSLCGYWLPGVAGIPFLRHALGRPGRRSPEIPPSN